MAVEDGSASVADQCLVILLEQVELFERDGRNFTRGDAGFGFRSG